MRQSHIGRIARAEAAAKARSRFSPQCICFPKNWPVEQEIAAKVKCPFHGDRFNPLTFFVYVSQWLREKRQILMQTHHSEQYRKAWDASFPPNPWPAQEVLSDAHTLRLKDGTTLPGNRREEILLSRVWHDGLN